jgi:hypothetical protein
MMGNSAARYYSERHEAQLSLVCAKRKIMADPWRPSIDRGERDYDTSACDKACGCSAAPLALCSTPQSSACLQCMLSGAPQPRTTSLRPGDLLGPDDMVSPGGIGVCQQTMGGRAAHIIQAPNPGWFSFAGTFITTFLLALTAVPPSHSPSMASCAR